MYSQKVYTDFHKRISCLNNVIFITKNLCAAFYDLKKFWSSMLIAKRFQGLLPAPLLNFLSNAETNSCWPVFGKSRPPSSSSWSDDQNYRYQTICNSHRYTNGLGGITSLARLPRHCAKWNTAEITHELKKFKSCLQISYHLQG